MTGYIHTTHRQGFTLVHDNFLSTLCVIRANILEMKRNEEKRKETDKMKRYRKK